MRSLAIIAALGGCASWTGGAAPPPIVVAPIVRAAAHVGIAAKVRLASVAAMPDDGLLVVGAGVGVRIDDVVDCTTADRSLFAIRFDGAGKARWMRCLAKPLHVTLVFAAVGESIWIVRQVDPNAHAHDGVHDLAVADRFSLDGAPLASRAIVTWRDRPEDVAERRAGALRLASVVATPSGIVLAGGAPTGIATGDHWEIGGTEIAGFVVAIPATGPARVVASEPAIDIADVATDGTTFAAIGRCRPMSESSLVACPGRAAVLVRGTLAGSELRARRIDLEFQSIHVAMDRAGDVTIAGGAVTTVAFDDTVIRGTCSDQWTFAASWSAADTLRFARAIGTCTREASQGIDTFDLASLDGRTFVTLAAHGAAEDDLPITFGKTTYVTETSPFGVVATLDATGALERVRMPTRDELADLRIAGTAHPWVVLATDTAIDVIPW